MFIRHMLSCMFTLLGVVSIPTVTNAQYAQWRHQGTLAILTTPDGADLPETVVERDFPLLVRLNRETFDFGQVNADGSDIRFSAGGKPLYYQIEQWDAHAGIASIWVRIPEIRGNTRQELALHWGRADAASESNGAAVFNASNGFAVVMHLDETVEPLRDDAGSVTPVDHGTTPCAGLIGSARHLEPGTGIACGEQIEGLPNGQEPCTTEAWIRAEQVNGTIVGWGNEEAQGKIVLDVRSPPHVRADGYFSGGTIDGERSLPMTEWAYVVHTFQGSEGRLYLNGLPDKESDARAAPLNIRRPARMWLGGWYNHYRFVGSIDEVRISKVARSADWIKLCFENQKPNQTLVGTLFREGNKLTVTPERISIQEGDTATVTADVTGVDKIYWILQRGGHEAIVASDRLSCSFDAGRILHDEECVLKLKAVGPSGTRLREIPVSVYNSIPEPEYTLEAPDSWNGRDMIEVIPTVTNQDAMAAAGAGELRYRWEIADGAVIHEVASDRLILRRSQFTGTIRVTSFIDNGGEEVARIVPIQITEPASDPWVHRVPEADEKPEEGQFYARDDRNEGTLHYNGKLDRPAESVFLRVFADEKLYATRSQTPTKDGAFAFAVELKPGLIQYRVEFGVVRQGSEQVLDRIGDLVCGDAYLIDGQSNALATDTPEESPRDTSVWVRSYAGPTGRGSGSEWLRGRLAEAERAGRSRPNLWCRPVWKQNAPEHQAELGWWGMELAKQLVETHQVPICIIQAAVGGSRIDEHQPTPDDHADLETMYGRMLWRVQQARLTHGIRAVIWHQGENDQGADGPTGRYGWETYQQYFVDMSAAWKEDMPNIQHYYVFQIWPNACAMGGQMGSGDRLREVQRTLPQRYSHMSIMATLGIQPPGGCHFSLEGWGEFARLLQPLIDRDLYGVAADSSLSPPQLLRARFADNGHNEIVLEFDQPVIWQDDLVGEFYLGEKERGVESGSLSGRSLRLKLKAPSAATRITYLKERNWSQDRLLLGANGIAALTFSDVPIELP